MQLSPRARNRLELLAFGSLIMLIWTLVPVASGK